MSKTGEIPAQDTEVEAFLGEIRTVMSQCLERTPLADVFRHAGNLLGQGKMLRSRMTFRLGTVNGTSRDHLVRAAAAVEMIHAASLLHDDVIDGGFLRRGAAAFWVDRGIPGAILLGDLILFKALELTTGINEGRLTQRLIELTGAVCEAESEQELVLRGTPPTWQKCLGIARRKTGSLFAFAGHASGGDDRVLSAALEEAGFAVGTAYQIADDILDAEGSEEESGKTLGTDQSRLKITAARLDPEDAARPASFIEGSCRKALELLTAWPSSQEAFRRFLKTDLGPVLDRHVGCLSRTAP